MRAGERQRKQGGGGGGWRPHEMRAPARLAAVTGPALVIMARPA